MNEAIELHDSTLAALRCDRDEVAVLLDPAYVHRSEGRPAVDTGTGWLQPFELRIGEADVFWPPASLPRRIAAGTLELGGERFGDVVPLPIAYAGPVLLTLLTDAGEQLVVAGRGLSCTPLGEARYLDEFP